MTDSNKPIYRAVAGRALLEEGKVIDDEITHALKPLLEYYTYECGYSPREIGYLVLEILTLLIGEICIMKGAAFFKQQQENKQ